MRGCNRAVCIISTGLLAACGEPTAPRHTPSVSRAVTATRGSRAITGAPLRLAFVSERELGIQIWSVREGGTDLIRITSARVNTQPTWSPDGSRIAYLCADEGVLNDDICLANADGSNEIRILAPGRELTLDWSHDGTRLAFSSDRSGTADLYTLEVANPSNVTPVFSSPGSDQSPRWSPDDSRIAFNSNMTTPVGGNVDIYVITLSTHAVTRVTTDPAQDHSPSWSPDGTRLAFASEERTPGERGNIFIADAVGGEAHLVRFTQLPGNVNNPDWSPDGKWMAIDWNEGHDGPYEIYKVSVDDPTILVNLSNSGANDEQSRWQRQPAAPPATDPATKADCKNGGWRKYGFRNQGQCDRFVETGKDSR